MRAYAMSEGPTLDPSRSDADGLATSGYWCFQVTEKLPPLILDGEAFTVLPVDIVIGSMPGVLLVSVAPLTVAPVKPTVPKSASGSTPEELDGASAMISAEASLADFSRCDVVCDQPFVVSLIVSVNPPRPSVLTDAVKWSPGDTGLAKFFGYLGYISYQAEYTARPLEQSASVPVCSTVLDPSPSSPTQKLDHPVGVTEQLTAGCVQFADTVL